MKPFARSQLLSLLLLFIIFAGVSPGYSADMKWLKSAPVPEWIWTEAPAQNGQKLFLFHAFELPQESKSAQVYSTCDNQMTLWINGEKIGESPDWPYPIDKKLDQKLSKGRNVIAVAAKNDGGVAAFVLKLKVETASGEIVEVTSSPEWSASLSETENWQTAGFPAGQSVTLSAKGKLGIPPWQIPTGNPPAGSGSGPLAADQITVPDGFEVELIYTVPKETEGSWVCLTTDPWGHLLASDQGGQGLYRIKVDGTDVEVKKVPANLSGAQGMTWAFNALYFNRSGGSLYRAIDTDNDQLVDTVEELPSARGGGEHGNHAVEPTEDGKQLYVVAGNHTDLPPLAGSRVPTWDEDLLLPRQWDARGHARGRLAPGGWVSRFDPEQKTYELYCIGFRNEYDIALNEAGDIFTYDADMEWDMGMPWYRPTRICQVVSGADYGWRSGTGKWPTYYEDSLPPVVEIGPGSPTGVVAGTNAAFPAKYRQAIFALDWTFGTIYAIHLKPEGAGYTGEREWFCFGAPLPVTDATIGKDGAMYFAVGGRGTQSALYRVRYTGKESTDDQYQESPAVVAARATRKKLEAFHGKQNAAAVTTAWPYLSSSDRFLRHAARIAVESQPVESWSAKLRSEQDPQAIITGCVALARMGKAEDASLAYDKLLSLNVKSLNDGQLLGMLRAYALTMIRLESPEIAAREQITQRLSALLPHENDDVNVELVRVLVALNDSSIIERVLTLMESDRGNEPPAWSELISRNAQYGGTIQGMLDNAPPTRQINYALMLRNLRNGWTIEQRKRYFTFLNQAAKATGGASYSGFLTNIREEALGNCNDAERTALADLTGENFDPVPNFPIHPPQGPGRAWTLDDASRVANRGSFPQASYENGRSLYFAAACGKCHRFAGLGGGVGPDLTSIRNKFDAHYLLESIIDPSKVVSDQYQSSTVVLANGKTLNGIVIEEGDKVTVYPPDPQQNPTTVSADDVDDISPSKTSQMPLKLIDSLSEAELQDLIAYLLSGGDPNSNVYGK